MVVIQHLNPQQKILLFFSFFKYINTYYIDYVTIIVSLKRMVNRNKVQTPIAVIHWNKMNQFMNLGMRKRNYKKLTI